MPQPRKVDRPLEVHTTLPQTLVARIYSHIYSELEERVPRGAMQTFLIRAATELLDRLEGKPQ